MTYNYFDDPKHDPYMYGLPDTSFIVSQFTNHTKLWEGNEQEVFRTNKRVLDNSKWRWCNEKIDYKTNSDGFRCDRNLDEIDWENTCAVIGCSFVFGQAMPDHLTISSILTNEYNVPCVNLGVPGGTNHMIHTNAIHLIRKYKPKKVFIIWTHLNRNTWVTGYAQREQKWAFDCQGSGPVDAEQAKYLKNRGYPLQFLKNYYTPHTMHEYVVYKEIHKLLGTYQISISDSSHDLRKLIQPKNLKPYDDWYDLFAESKINGIDTKDESMYDIINKFCARDCIWDGKRIHLGHWGEVILRDMADKIYRENFK